MIVESFAAGPLGCNCTLIVDEESKEAIVVDPGGDLPRIEARLARHGAKVKAILHTHTHIDHVGATAGLQRAHAAAARIHEGDGFMYSILPVQAALLGMGAPPESAELDRWLVDDEVVRLGGPGASIDVHVLHTPGHSPGSCCFEVAAGDERLLLAGDTLFQQSVGRTDLWGGDHDALVKSIRGKLFALPDPTRVICGHGPDTTIGVEKRSNPFVGLAR
jgi:hydroxyacylglutathione hydrolase